MPPRKKTAAPVAEQLPVTTRSSRSKTKAAEAGAGASVTNKSEPTTRAGGIRTGSGSQAMAKKGSGPKELSPSPQTPTITAPKKAASSTNPNKREAQNLVTNTTKPTAKKAARGKTQLPLVSARTTPPTESSAEPEEITSARSARNNTFNEEANPSNKISRRNMRKRSRDAVEVEVENGKEIDVTIHKKAKTGLLAVGTKKQGTRKYTPFMAQNVEPWFETYQDEGQDGVKGSMSPAACNKWMEELGISEESAAFYVLAWKLGAKTMFTLTRQEFVEGMKKLGVDSNERLLDILPVILNQVIPSFESLDFKSFYKFCFNYGKSGGPPGAKNVELPIAVEFLKVVLDQDRYRIDYTPAATGPEVGDGKKTEGSFPHLHTFLEFLQKATKLKVLNRDQWESFLPFNKSVGWGLEGYSEDSAWPSLFDEYADWKKMTYPETIAQSNADGQDDKDMTGYAP